MPKMVRIGCGAGFAGDRDDASLPIIADLARHRGPRFLIFEMLRRLPDGAAHLP
jgi:hypothetical protein